MYLSLHTADPDDMHPSATEIAYEGYQPIRLDRIRWIRDGGDFVNFDEILFPLCTKEPRPQMTATHFAIRDALIGPALLKGPLDDGLIIHVHAGPFYQEKSLRLPAEVALLFRLRIFALEIVEANEPC